ncbi:receptor-like protein kinase FERONIA isoform X2 [Amaranthus tricolor]|uniref:receptor-like protein kinase FERONIA isoform X2 n=1 Tax=Amaranthus tricolor TaxID=29722 RepID=UPI002588F423|nr:receptor-like protein kinase FERONIA isoform X2 [Amaranthus tricolor]
MENIFPLILLFILILNTIQATNYIPTDTILLDCGSFDLQATDSNGRKWRSDSNSKFLLSSKRSFKANAGTQSRNISTIPYISARVFQSNLTYSFPVSSGRKFLRIHFYPNTYSRWNSSNAIFSVTAGSYTLLRNYNPLKNAEDLGVNYVVKEYSIYVENGELIVTFIASEKAFGYVNGIEVVSMPSMYGDDNIDGVSIVGAATSFLIDNSTVLESLYRLNVGGTYVSPANDTGLFRSWYDDTPYISSIQIGSPNTIDPDVNITFPKSLPSYTAPINMYSTARFMTPNNNLNLKFNLTWSLPIHSGFAYLTAVSEVDVIALAQSNGIPYVMDFVVILPVNEDNDEQDLWVALHPNIRNKPQYYNGFLNGLEILKINNTDGTL